MINASINGFGRIGRTALRVWLNRPDLQEKINITAINTSGSMDIEGWAHLLKYDSSYGKISQDINVEALQASKDATDDNPLIGYLNISDKKISIFAQRDPEKLPWGKNNIDVVIESTGVFRDQDGAGKHLTAGAKKVLISAPSKGEGIGTHVLGVNQYNGTDSIADNASCTTNCIAPIVKVIFTNFGIQKAALTTIHGFNDSRIDPYLLRRNEIGNAGNMEIFKKILGY